MPLNNNCFRVGQKKSFFIQPSVRRTRGFNRYLFYFSPGNFGCGRKPAVLPDRSFVAVILENDIRSTDVSKLRSRISKRYFFLSIKNSCVKSCFIFQKRIWAQTFKRSAVHNVQNGFCSEIRTEIGLQFLSSSCWSAHSGCPQAYSE